MAILHLALIIGLILFSSALITFDFHWTHQMKRLLFRGSGIFAFILIAIKAPFLTNGNFAIGICFSIWIVGAGLFFVFTNDFCPVCAYPVRNPIFKRKFCPKCGKEVHEK
ncbi:hypothetical protein EBR57_08435 [bacterium]|nr:hypothetical protein [bacterium]